MLKSYADKKAKQKAREFMLKAAKDNGFDLESLMTDNINDNLDSLLQAIIDDVGYVKLAKMGVK